LKISVSLAYNVFEPLTYHVSAEAPAVKIGMRVLVPLGKKIVSGWVLGLDSSYPGKLKNIIGIIDDPFCPDERFLEFIRRSAIAYFASAGVLLDHALPASKKNLKKLCSGKQSSSRMIPSCSCSKNHERARLTPTRQPRFSEPYRNLTSHCQSILFSTMALVAVTFSASSG